MLAVKFGIVINFAIQSQAGQNGPFNRLLVRDGQSARVPKANRANGRVWFFIQIFVQVGAPAEHLAFGIKLDVDFQPDDYVVHNFLSFPRKRESQVINSIRFPLSQE